MPNESNKSKAFNTNYQDPKLIDRWARFLGLVGKGLSDEQVKAEIKKLFLEANPAAAANQPSAGPKV